ncbi:Protein of unknown function (DUF2961) [Chthonomonas calidirosea]|uniref:DUF2961 domain-containing protein n=1 Tax=Chthonomonas calidirosea (strain DSM 23976 / ICMP 18418 / T49) TaxID=1303518 RepID=S0ESU9_CHTCT|nr:DUF2961 domain-containing protein [Chthonomonas calidirosea]CCW34456.1 Protein of unknown function (DUF2961) [Chthonomonas calidirosea T49]CEK14733.1 Protein of unknown function (DUF2961) [Chthonomonas calidirosea]
MYQTLCQALIAVILALGAEFLYAQQSPVALPNPINGPGSTLSLAPRAALPHSPPLPYGLELLSRFDLLPYLRDSRCVQDSSYDRNFYNADFGHFLRVEGHTAVLADIRGPGCIYRFWSANAAGHLRIYFDGAATPTIDCAMQDFFLGKVPPFLQPLVGHKSGGWYCYFPMPFQKHCLITVTDPGPMYYHVEYQLYPDSTRIATFSPQLHQKELAALGEVLEQWGHLGLDPKPSVVEEQAQDVQTECVPGQPLTLANLSGAGEIDALHIRLDPANRYTLRQTVLRIYWDGATRPAVEAPVGDFFGAGFGKETFAALPDAMNDQGGFCYWPMPFTKSARIELINYGQRSVNVLFQMRYHRLGQPLKDAGYFHARWHRQINKEGENFHILEVQGRGLYVGEHTAMQGDRGIWFLEGNEEIWVDGESFPSIIGTGTEDFYTAGWYFDEGPFNEAFHGCILKDEAHSRVDAYRYQITDCVPFQKSIRVDIQHGPIDNYPGSDYACVAYWYQTAPDDNWSPLDPTQLTPTHWHAQDAIEAESLRWTSGDPQVIDDMNLPVLASGGAVVELHGGTAACVLPVAKEGDYILSLVQPPLAGTARLGQNWAVDDPKQVGPAPTEAIRADETNSVHQTLHLTAGDHTLFFQIPTGQTLYLDYLTLRRLLHPNSIPATDLKVVEATDGEAQIQDMTGFGPYWDNNQQLWFTGHRQGAQMTVELPVEKTGSYELSVYYTTARDYAIVQVLLDGNPIGQPTDCYTPNVQAKDQTILGNVMLTAGVHRLTFRAVGKNPASTNYLIGVDAIGLKPLP